MACESILMLAGATLLALIVVAALLLALAIHASCAALDDLFRDWGR